MSAMSPSLSPLSGFVSPEVQRCYFENKKGFNVLGTGPALAQQQKRREQSWRGRTEWRPQGGCSGLWRGRMEPLGPGPRGSPQPPPSWPDQHPRGTQKAPRFLKHPEEGFPGRFSQSNTSGGRLASPHFHLNGRALLPPLLGAGQVMLGGVIPEQG